MKFATAAAALALAASSVLAHPLDSHNIQDAFEKLQERSSIVVTTGALGTNVYPRYEVQQLQSSFPNQWTLFLLAMQQWKAESTSNPASYYGVAGIHGVPRQNYNNVAQCSGTGCSNAVGYCTHNMVLFPAWHRTYLALFEQELIQIAHSIANAWPSSSRATMQNAANLLRLPYWDWAAHPASGSSSFPSLFTQPTISVNGPKGAETIENPLYRYFIADPSVMYYADFINWNHTLRWPSNDGSNPYSVESLAVSAFSGSNRQSLQDSVYSLMTQCSDYLHFSNAANNPGSTSCTTSLEGIHNTVHTLSGGVNNSTYISGHMTYLPTAAFDPIFWLHHANVDRLFAFWQTLHPSSYGANQNAPGATWAIAQGTALSATYPLYPFYKDNSGDFWNTNEVQNWAQTFKYTYPEYVDSSGSSSAIASYVSKLYGPSATATAGSTKHTAGSHAEKAASPVKNPVAEVTQAVSKVVGALTDASSQTSSSQDSVGDLLGAATQQYSAQIQYPLYALNNSYSIHVFNGAPQSEEPFSWTFDPNQIGMVGVPSMSGMTANAGVGSGSVPLTRTLNSLIGTGLLSSLEEAIVVPFLASKLQWRIAGPQGASLDPRSVQGFVVSVVSNSIQVSNDPGTLPTYSPLKVLPAVTHGKPGGLNSTSSTTTSSTGGACNAAKKH